MNKNTYHPIIAIDPDCNKSGVAVLCKQTKSLELSSKTFPELLDFLQSVKNNYENAIVIVEAGYLIRSNWHLTRFDSKQTAAAKGNSAGRNHEVGRKIVEMLKHYGIEYIEQRPLVKCWNGPDRKITHKELASFTGIKGRTNQEERDAALIAWLHAGLPIRMKKKLLYNTLINYGY